MERKTSSLDFSPFKHRLRFHLVPDCGVRVQFSLGTNVTNLFLFTPEFGHCVHSVRVQGLDFVSGN